MQIKVNITLEKINSSRTNGKPPQAGENKLSLEPSSRLIQDLRYMGGKSYICD